MMSVKLSEIYLCVWNEETISKNLIIIEFTIFPILEYNYLFRNLPSMYAVNCASLYGRHWASFNLFLFMNTFFFSCDQDYFLTYVFFFFKKDFFIHYRL